MPRYSNIRAINRIIDANTNRAKEGLRVCEEIARFILNSRTLTSQFKSIRHKINAVINRLPPNIIIKDRESLKDVGKEIYINELRRRDYQDIFFANIQRVKESVRVLEEFTKLINTDIAVEFKKIRYRIYEIEKKAVRKLPSLCNYR